jgi:tyrosine-specific transport protein
LGGDLKRVRLAILGGSIFIFFVYVIWEIVSLGILPMDGEYGIYQSYKGGIDAAAALTGYVQNITIGTSAQFFALFAILTSFLAQTMTLSHFLGDGLKAKNRDSIGLVVLALVPPLLFEILNPTVFYLALNFAGGICAVILFGMMPAFMMWKGHHQMGHKVHVRFFASKVVISIIALFSLFILVYTLSELLGFFPFAHP